MSMARVVDRNIRALLEHRQEQQGNRSRQERTADAVTRFAGSMRFVYIHLVVFGAWIVINLGLLPASPGSIRPLWFWRWLRLSRRFSSLLSS